MAAKRFETRTEQIEQLLHDKSSKSTNKATDNAARTLSLLTLMIWDLFYMQITGICNILQ